MYNKLKSYHPFKTPEETIIKEMRTDLRADNSKHISRNVFLNHKLVILFKMKQLFILMSIIPCISFGQKLEQNKTDEFTKAHIKITSWETLNSFGFANKLFAFTRIRKIDSTYLLDFKVTLRSGSVFSIREGDELMIKTSDSVIALSNLKYQISCTGCGVKGFTGSGLEGIEVTYEIPASEVFYLSNNKIKKIRVYISDGYVEDDIKDKNAQMFVRQLKLVY